MQNLGVKALNTHVDWSVHSFITSGLTILFFMIR